MSQDTWTKHDILHNNLSNVSGVLGWSLKLRPVCISEPEPEWAPHHSSFGVFNRPSVVLQFGCHRFFFMLLPCSHCLVFRLCLMVILRISGAFSWDSDLPGRMMKMLLLSVAAPSPGAIRDELEQWIAHLKKTLFKAYLQLYITSSSALIRKSIE